MRLFFGDRFILQRSLVACRKRIKRSYIFLSQLPSNKYTRLNFHCWICSLMWNIGWEQSIFKRAPSLTHSHSLLYATLAVCFNIRRTEIFRMVFHIWFHVHQTPIHCLWSTVCFITSTTTATIKYEKKTYKNLEKKKTHFAKLELSGCCFHSSVLSKQLSKYSQIKKKIVVNVGSGFSAAR